MRDILVAQAGLSILERSIRRFPERMSLSFERYSDCCMKSKPQNQSAVLSTHVASRRPPI
jgi:hypothetical protein